ncbi:hypothetical protein EV177_001140 [Coemansia sp. RSA 1804]|nr:hypothetical protein EV177_001140 [Coemansia sp. RSA 1804]
MGRMRNRLQSLFGMGATAIEPCTDDSHAATASRPQNTSFASAFASHFRSHNNDQPIQKPPTTAGGPGTHRSSLHKRSLATSTRGTGSSSGATTYFALDQKLPYATYDSYSSGSRLLLDTGGGRILKTFFSDSLVPLEDEGVGRLKAVYEAWLPNNGCVSRDKIGGIYTISLVCNSGIEGAMYCDGKTTVRSLQKHHVECLYSGTGLRRGCSTKNNTASITSGVEIWIKGSLPITGPWVQSMFIPPDHRLNRLCMIAAPKPNLNSYVNLGTSLVELPELTAKLGGDVFGLDSNVYIYLCRLSPCSSVCHTVKPAAKSSSEPPVFEIPKIHRAATLPITPSTARLRSPSDAGPRNTHAASHSPSQQQLHSPRPCNFRSLFIHSITTFDKHGSALQGGSCLMLPGSIHLKDGNGIHMKQVTPGADILIKNVGYDRAQFILIDMPAYVDDADDAKSI